MTKNLTMVERICCEDYFIAAISFAAAAERNKSNTATAGRSVFDPTVQEKVDRGKILWEFGC